MRSLKNARLLITGASSGIGRALAVRCAEQGAHVFLNGRQRESLESTASACRKFGGIVAFDTGDVSSRSVCARLVELTVSHLGGLDVLICNAGVSMWSRLEDVEDTEVFDYLMQVNYLSVVYLCREALPHLRRNQGMIVGVSSLAAKTGVPTRSGYCASKAAATAFLEALRIEVAPAVKVLVVFPGMVATAFRARSLGPDGSPIGNSPRDESRATMSVDRCVDLILKGIQRERREVVMTFQARVGAWLRLIAPGVVDAMAKKSVKEARGDLSRDAPDH